MLQRFACARLSVLTVLTVLTACVLSACSSSSSGTSSSSGSSGSGSDLDCSFTGVLSGGVEAGIVANGCGTSPSSTFSIAQADLVAGTSIGVRFVLVTPLKGGELGPLPLQTFEVFQRSTKAGTTEVWSSKSCTLTLEKNEASPTMVFTNRFLLAGRGSCSAPLEPTAPNVRPAVTVTDFRMTAFVDP